MINNVDKYPTIDPVATGRNIKQLRIDRNVKIAALQQYLNLSEPQAIYHWERGLSMPTTDHLVALAHYYGITVDEIIVRSYVPAYSVKRTNKITRTREQIGFMDFSFRCKH